MNCPHCKASNTATAAYCARCGTALTLKLGGTRRNGLAGAFNPLVTGQGWKFRLTMLCGGMALFAFLALPWITALYFLDVSGLQLATRSGLVSPFMHGFQGLVEGSISGLYGGDSMAGSYGLMAAGLALLWLVPAGALCSIGTLLRGKVGRIVPVAGAALGLLGLVLYTSFTFSAALRAAAAFGDSFLGGLLGGLGKSSLGAAGSLINFAGPGYILAWIALAGQAAFGALAWHQLDQMDGEFGKSKRIGRSEE